MGEFASVRRRAQAPERDERRTSFSYADAEAGEERFVGVPEQGGRSMTSPDPMPPGVEYTASVAADGTVGMFRNGESSVGRIAFSRRLVA